MSIEIKLRSGDKIIRDLAEYPARAVKIYSQAVQRGTEVLRDATKKLPPVSAKRTGYGAKGIPVDTGRLRQSIQKKQLSLLAAGVTTGVKYGPFVHEGTSRVTSRPFFEWALELGALKEIDDIFDEAASRLP